ncbi:MAG: putative O-glycosylation ligase, exosortase A system-associated [Alphaproteobacteria bacterium]
MRGLIFFTVFFALLPTVFKRPYIGILMWFWISLMNPHRVVYGFAGAIPYAMLVAIVTLVSWLLIHQEEPKAPPRDRTTFLLIALMLWISITTLIGTGGATTIVAVWAESEKMLLMTVVAYILTNTRQRLDQLVVVCVLSVIFYGVKGGLFVLLTGGSYRVYGPAASKIGDNNDLGVALTMMLPLLVYLAQQYSHRYLKWPIRGLIGLTVIGDLFTYSRGALLAVGAMTSVLWLRMRHKLAIAVVLVGAAFAVFLFAPAAWFERMQTIESYDEDSSALGRLFFWQLSWVVAQKHPITGAGFDWSYNPNWVNSQTAGTGLPPLMSPRAPHSIWFKMLSNHGFVGLTLFVGLFVAALLNAQWLIRRTRDNPDLAWANNFGRMIQASLAGFMVGSSFGNLDMYDGLYVLVIMVAAARRIVAVELADQRRAVEQPIVEPVPAVAASDMQAARPLVRT